MDDSMMEEWEFPSDEEVDKITGARVVVTAYPNERDPERRIAVPKTLTNGQRIIEILTKVPEGELKNTRATLTLWVDITNPGFRKQVELITGIAVSKGAKANMEDIIKGLEEFSFHVTLGKNDRGYTLVKFLNERVAKIALEEDAAIPTGYDDSFSMDDDDDSIPF